MKKVKLNDFFNFKTQEPINRLAYTKEDMDYKIKIINKMKELGMNITVDTVGNICGSITIGDKKGKTIAIGSHTDSVYDGGQYDGPVGVIVGLQTAEQLIKKPNYNGTIKIAIYACEESSRFGNACIGSKFLNGNITEADFEKITDKKDESITLADAIKDSKDYLKQKVEGIQEVDKIFNEVDYSLEAHTEQYSVLNKEFKKDKNIDIIGIVTSIGSALRIKYDVQGKMNHTGSTPMKKRKNAVDVASYIGLAVRKLGKNYEKNGLGRASQVEIETPGHNQSFNQLSDKAEGYVDIRLLGSNTPDNALNEFEEIVKDAKNKFKTEVNINVISKGTPIKTNEELNSKIENVCNRINIRNLKMPSYAGQDTGYIPAKQKTMIFIPSKGGSHNPNEFAKRRAIKSATKVFENMCDELLQENFKETNKVNYTPTLTTKTSIKKFDENIWQK